MNIKLHTPKSLANGSGLATVKQFLLSLVATTISIVLTFGTAYFVDKHKKESQKREMVMMLIYDFDQSLQMMQKNDSSFQHALDAQLAVARHPEQYDSLRFLILDAIMASQASMQKTTEQIFTSSIETFNTISNAYFIKQVSSFYMSRQSYTDAVREAISGPAEKYPPAESIENFLQMDFPELVYLSGSYLEGMTNIRNICMEMMHISEKELAAFSKKYTLEPQQDDEKKLERMTTMMNAEETLMEARKKYPVEGEK